MMDLKPKIPAANVLASFGVQFFNQTTGALVINNYLTQILSRLGVTGGTPLLLIGESGAESGFAYFPRTIC